MTPASWRDLPTDSWFLRRVNSTWILDLQNSNMLSTLGHSPGNILIVSLRRQDAFSTWSSSRKTLAEREEDFLRFGSVEKNPTDVKLWLEGAKKKGFGGLKCKIVSCSHGQITWDIMFFPLGSTSQRQTSHPCAVLHNPHHTKPRTRVKQTTNM